MTRPPHLPGGPIEAVIFDLDGVLVSSIPAHYEAFRRTFAAEGREFSWEEYLRVGAGAARDVTIRRVMGELTPEKLDELMRAKVRHVTDYIEEQGLEPIPGAADFVRRVRRRGLKTAVATASRTPDLLLGGAGLAGLFDTVVDRGQVDRPKPHPDLFLAAAERIGIAPPRCLVLEDSPAGIESGVAAEMRVLALTTSEPADRLGRAHGVFDSFEEIDLDVWTA